MICVARVHYARCLYLTDASCRDPPTQLNDFMYFEQSLILSSLFLHHTTKGSIHKTQQEYSSRQKIC